MIKSCRFARALVPALAWLAFAEGLALFPAQAWADPVEELAGVTVGSGDRQKIVLGYENGLAGLLVSGDGGHSFRLRPSQSVHTLMPDSYFPRTDFPILLTPDALLVGGTGGLLTGDAETCGLTQGSTLLDDPVLTLAPHPSDPDQTFLASFKITAAHGGLFRRDKIGALTQLGPDDADDLTITRLQVVTREASREHLRFVEAGARATPDGSGSAPLVRYSDDLGATWTEHPVTLPGNGTIKLLAVDPLDPDRVLIVGRNDPIDLDGRVLPDPVDDVLLSLDAGKQFASYSSSVISGRYATFAPDGRFWLGDAAGGLYFAERLGDPLSKVSELAVRGLSFDDSSDELLVAQPYELGRFKPSEHSYCQMFRIYEALAFPTCSDENIAMDSRTKLQVCTSFCNASHFWYAPVCRNYHDVAAACGLGVLGTAFATLPNMTNEAPRCDGFALNYVDPIGSAPDAGAGAADGGAPQTDDAAAPTSNGDGAAGADRPVAPRPPHSGGCSVADASTRGPGYSLAGAAAFLLIGLSIVRRAGASDRRADTCSRAT